MASYLTGIALLLLVISPPLVPAVISGIRAVANWPATYQRLRRRFIAAPMPAFSPAH